MIKLNYLLGALLLILLLSLESVLTWPLFSTFIFFKFLDRFSWKDDGFWFLFVLLLVGALFVALFYQLAISLSLVLFLVYYLGRSFFGGRLFGQSRQKWQILQLSLFMLFQLSIMLLAGLQFNFFLILELILASVLFVSRSSTMGRL